MRLTLKGQNLGMSENILGYCRGVNFPYNSGSWKKIKFRLSGNCL